MGRSRTISWRPHRRTVRAYQLAVSCCRLSAISCIVMCMQWLMYSVSGFSLQLNKFNALYAESAEQYKELTRQTITAAGKAAVKGCRCAFPSLSSDPGFFLLFHKNAASTLICIHLYMGIVYVHEENRRYLCCLVMLPEGAHKESSSFGHVQLQTPLVLSRSCNCFLRIVGCNTTIS